MREKNLQKATFGAGCFWGVEATFRRVNGVLSTRVGFMGGTLENPRYEDVCTGTTGHAEVVDIEYDPSIISYNDLLKVFWENHDPTTLNRQGLDIGVQYRSVIFFHNEKQKIEAIHSKERLQKSKRFKTEIVTEITPATQFYKAEDYHQQYYEKRGRNTCSTT